MKDLEEAWEEERQYVIRSKGTLRRIEKSRWRKEIREKVYMDLVERGPCTARDIFNDICGPWDKMSVHTVSCALVDLKAEGRVKSTMDANNINLWEAI